MTLPFGTRVRVHHAPELIPACVLSRTENVSEEYLIVWPSGQHDRVLRQHMTVIESAAESALREIGRMLRLPLDAEPAAIVGAVADLKARLFAEVSKPPVCVKIDPARFVSLGNGLRTVTAEAVRDGDWVWGHYRADDRAIVVWGAPCQKEPHHKTFADRNYIIGPDPATLICEAPPAPAEETVWGEP